MGKLVEAVDIVVTVLVKPNVARGADAVWLVCDVSVLFDATNGLIPPNVGVICGNPNDIADRDSC